MIWRPPLDAQSIGLSKETKLNFWKKTDFSTENGPFNGKFKINFSKRASASLNARNYACIDFEI